MHACEEWLNLLCPCCKKAFRISNNHSTKNTGTQSIPQKSQSLDVLYVHQDAVSIISFQDANSKGEKSESPNLMESPVDEYDSESKKSMKKTPAGTSDQTEHQQMLPNVHTWKTKTVELATTDQSNGVKDNDRDDNLL